MEKDKEFNLSKKRLKYYNVPHYFEKDVKEFIKRICAKMNCGWRVDIIKELAGKDLT